METIFSVASDSSVAHSLENPRSVILNNTELMISLLEACRFLKPAKFIHISTDEVYGEVWDNKLHKESYTYSPSNPYSASKTCQEAIAYSYWRTFETPLILINCMNMFGKRQNPEKMIPKAIRYIYTGQTLPIYTSKGKVGTRVYLDVNNLTDALFFIDKNVMPKLYLRLEHQEHPVKYHVTGGTSPIDNLELIKKKIDF